MCIKSAGWGQRALLAPSTQKSGGGATAPLPSRFRGLWLSLRLVSGFFAPLPVRPLACTTPGSRPLTLDVSPPLNTGNSTSRFIRNNCP